MPESSLQQVANSDGRNAVLSRPRLEADEVRVMDLNLGSIFDQQKPFIAGYQASHGIEETRFSGARSAGQSMFLRLRT